MKIVKKILLIVLILIVVAIAAFSALLFILSRQPVVKDGYYNSVSTGGALEGKYTAPGEHEVLYIEYEASDVLEKYEIWYPAEMTDSTEVYPLVVMANGSGIPASKYKAIFEHLASWGFIVIGNEDPSSWSGVSCADSLDFMLKCNQTTQHIFYQKINTQSIGIAGHSQGGVGAVNAVTAQESGHLYRAVYAASTTHLALAEALKWPYQSEKLNVPTFFTAGTLQADAGDGADNAGIAPLWSLQESYAAISDDVPKAMARRTGIDHGDVLPYADGYMTAWFMYWLNGDTAAGSVFFGEDAEILTNPNWQDIQINDK